MCRDPSRVEDRKRWGCDAPVEPWEHIDCIVCSGEEAACDACDSTRKLPLDRCPWTYIGPREVFVCEVATLMESGMSPWPDTGWADWPASFCDALQLVMHERGVIAQKEQERAARRGK